MIERKSQRRSGRSAIMLVTMGALWTLLGTAPLTQADTTVSASEQLDKALDENRRVCRRIPVTGTHFKRRICKTAAAWEAEAEAAREFVEKLERGQDVEQIHINRQGSL